MSGTAFKKLRKQLKMPVCRKPLDSYAWPSGYPIYYIFSDGGAICPDCVNTNVSEIVEANNGKARHNSHGGWAVDGWDVNYDDADLTCDHCNKPIEAAYVSETEGS